VSSNTRVLVVDDEQSMRDFLEIFFKREGYAVETAPDVATALVAVEADEFDVVITDIQMPDRTGLDLLRELRRHAPDVIVIMITAFASTETAIAAMKEGAYDYITKPFKVDEIRIIVEKALEKKRLASENQRLRRELRSQSRSRPFVGNSLSMQRIYDLIGQVAETKTNVLISGESGTGKELVARAIHENSDRRDKLLVTVNCGAIPENLLESELFGHVKGAFTGAVQSKAGLFEIADQGTLFLDEVGELPAPLQVKLLRAIQEKTIRRVGDTKDHHVDVRILAATNRHLESDVASGRFREDLYYRLNVIQLSIPPLRERIEDVPLLVHYFLEKYSRELKKNVNSVSEKAMDCLFAYSFPGNVRELENIIERAVALSKGECMEVEALPPTVLSGASPKLVSRIPAQGVQLEKLVSEYERDLLREALGKAGGVKKQAARLLGISFRSFRYRLEKLGLDDLSDAGD